MIIGGGINGAAIANIAAGRGFKVALIEKGDFAGGTSSKSTKLIHGGIRYLENLEFDLVGEALRERLIQMKSAPHLVKALPFFIPVYKNDRRPLWVMKLGVFLYDWLAGKFSIGRHESLTKEGILSLIPNLKKEGLLGGVKYFDAQMDDARLCLENILTASRKGAHIANYAQVKSFLKANGKVIGVGARDLINDEHFEIKAKKIICAVGPWTNHLLRLDDPSAKKKLRTTKGVHIVYKGNLSPHALLVPSTDGKRIFFVIPWMGNSLIGTTDTDCIDQPDTIKAESADITYLLTEARRVFPDIQVTDENIISVFAGLRPLMRRGGISPSKVSRKHDIFTTPSGITFVIGGKYTTYRRIAIDCLNMLTQTKETGKEKDFALYGGGEIAESAEAVAEKYNIEIETVRALFEKYGSRYNDVLRLIDDDSRLIERFCACNPFIKAQIAYSIKTEMAQTADDIISRRLSLHHLPCKTQNCRNIIQGFLQRASA